MTESNFSSWRSVMFGLPGILCLCGTMLAISAGTLQANDGDTPAWQKGFSRWNGQGYDPVPKSPTTTDALHDPSPYTVPIDPMAKSRMRLPALDQSALSLVPPRYPSVQDALTMPPISESGGIDEIPDVLVVPRDFADDDSWQVESLPDNTLAAEPDANPDANAESDPIETPTPELDSISAQVSNGQVVEEAPLQTEIEHWYHYPRQWMRGWDSNAEFGLNGSSGNATTLAIQTGLELKRQSDRYTLAIDADYRQASSRNKTTEDNGRLNVDYDRLIADSSWSGFAKYGMEWDRFKAFDLRVNMNGGLGYYWVRRDDATFSTKFGAGTSREIGAPIDDWIAEAVFGMNAERQLTSRQKLTGKIDYFPAWENFGEFRLVSDIAWEILLDGTENLSLKLAATDRYDSTPQGAKPNDLYYSLLLLYKF